MNPKERKPTQPRFKRLGSSSSSLSELEDVPIEKVIPIKTHKTRSGSRIPRAVKTPTRAVEATEVDPGSSAKILQLSRSKEACKSGKLVQAEINGKSYLLPFELLSECEPVQYPVEGNERPVPIRCQRTETEPEVFMGKKNLTCGDYSFINEKKDPVDQPQAKKDQVRIVDFVVAQGSPEVKTAKQLRVDQKPIQCPVTSCSEMICGAFFSTHMKLDHPRVLLETIAPGQTRKILVDPRLNQFGKNRCNVVYYMVNKLRDFGNSEFKNSLPVLLMSTKLRSIDLETASDQPTTKDSSSYLHRYWLTGIVSERLRVSYNLAIGSSTTGAVCCSGSIYPLSQGQNLHDVFHSGTGLTLSQQRVDQLQLQHQEQLLEMSISLN